MGITLSSRVIIIGLDSVPPALAFELFGDRMPCLSRLRAEGRWGALRSTDPPITVPAWVTMTSGRDPGQLGIYGFRRRQPGSYEMRLVGARDVTHPRIWDLAARAGMRSVVVAVPPTYPPQPIAKDGVLMTSCFLTPGSESPWAAPDDLRQELGDRFGPYIVDTEAHRGGDQGRLVDECRALTAQRFAIFRHLVATRDPELAMVVDIGPDRFHHGLLGAVMPDHPRHDRESPFARAGAQYYELLDQEIAKTMDLAGPETLVMVVSDHGVRPLEGGVCVNEWLRNEGYLVLEEEPTEPTPLGRCRVDWSKTRAWGEGGYHARICFNVAGREPRGVVPAAALGGEVDRLAERARQLAGPGGSPMDNRVIVPKTAYRELQGLPPDLMIYWDGLARRSIGSLGHGAIHVAGNDTGADDANHDPDGIYVAWGRSLAEPGGPFPASITDVFATAVDALEIAAPAGTSGSSMMGNKDMV
jgi:predicted AlkP superfamily phosphohydrolase/phosphomutase